MARKRPATTSTPAPAADATPAPVADPTPAPAAVADASTTTPSPVDRIVSILTADDPQPGPVADVLRTLTPSQRTATSAAVPGAILAGGHPADVLAVAVGVLTAASDLARGPAPAAPVSVDDMLAALANLVTAADVFGVAVGDQPGPRTPAGRFLAAARAIPASPDAASTLARIGIRGTGGRATTSQTGGPRTRTDRSAGRDLANLAGIELHGPNDALAHVNPDGSVGVVTADGTSHDAASLTAAANLAAGPGASVNGWLGWRTSDGRTADAVARGVVASQ